MAHVQASDISLAFGDRDILSHVSLTLSSGDRCALAGANGSGKSTLMKILAGIGAPDSGSVVTSAAARVIYLPQSGITHAGRSLIEEIELAYGDVVAIVEERDRLGREMQGRGADDPALPRLIEDHHELYERIERSGYFEREAEVDRVLTGLGFRRSDFERKTDEFSGGWQMRIALAKVLLQRPDFLLLDEPTNYLDVEARVWLGGFLASYQGGVLMVSHDRRFLDQSVNSVWELFLAQVKRYRGTYTEYERRREEEIARIKAEWEQQQDEIRHIEDFIRRFRATASKARQVQSRVKQLEKMERIEIPEHLKRLHITFPPAPRSGREVVTLHRVSRAYGANQVLSNLELIVERGERVVLVGPNGAGKSTLMRIVAGRDPDHGGTVRYGSGVSGGFYADDDSRLSRLSRARDAAEQTSAGPSVLDATLAAAHGQTEQQIRDMLGSFLFRGDDVYKSVHVLSGGERSRLSMLQLLLQPNNLLVLDEPTNHLDMASKDVLLDALRQFGGTIVFVSHDRDFIEQLATRVVELRPDPADASAPSQVSDFAGDYHYYAWRLEHAGETVETGPTRTPQGAGDSRSESCSADSGAAAPEGAGAATQPRSHEEQKALRSRRQKLERTVEGLLHEIEDAERRHEALQQGISKPEVYEDGNEVKRLTAELNEVERRIASLTESWESAAAELDALGTAAPR
ncbi:MAG: ATP-binding cassette domain-containing protein [Spirochaetota bacterium]